MPTQSPCDGAPVSLVQTSHDCFLERSPLQSKVRTIASGFLVDDVKHLPSYAALEEPRARESPPPSSA